MGVLESRCDVSAGGNLENGATEIIFTFLESLGPMAKMWNAA
jgi:hypothetical protein